MVHRRPPGRAGPFHGARLIFCFFAEDTAIFHGDDLFTTTIAQMSARDSSNTHEVISEFFRAMNIPVRHEGQMDNRYREAAKIKGWANVFPYVNGDLFSDSVKRLVKKLHTQEASQEEGDKPQPAPRRAVPHDRGPRRRRAGPGRTGGE